MVGWYIQTAKWTLPETGPQFPDFDFAGARPRAKGRSEAQGPGNKDAILKYLDKALKVG